MGEFPQTVQGKLIQFFCMHPEHAEPSGPDQLSIHDDRWAFCPRGVIASDHRWEPTGGITLTEITVFASSRKAS